MKKKTYLSEDDKQNIKHTFESIMEHINKETYVDSVDSENKLFLRWQHKTSTINIHVVIKEHDELPSKP